MRKRHILFLLSTCCLLRLPAQDVVFSQFYSTPIYNNPAYTGFRPGISAQAGRRSQWLRIDGPSLPRTRFTTNYLALSMALCKLWSGFGLEYMENVEGAGYLNRQSLSLSYGWRNRPEGYFARRQNDDLEINLGFRGRYNWASLNHERWVFSDQLDPINGIVRPSAIPPQFLDLPASYMDFDAGGFIFKVIDRRNASGSDYFLAGFTANHLVNVDPQQPRDEGRPHRYTFYTGYGIRTNYNLGFTPKNNLYVSPMIKAEAQPATGRRQATGERFWSWHVQSGINFWMADIDKNNDGAGLWGGLWWQGRAFPNSVRPSGFENTNSLVLTGGIEIGRPGSITQIGAAYEYTYSGLRSDSGGTLELVMSINFTDVDPLSCGPGRASTRIDRRCPPNLR